MPTRDTKGVQHIPNRGGAARRDPAVAKVGHGPGDTLVPKGYDVISQPDALIENFHRTHAYPNLFHVKPVLYQTDTALHKTKSDRANRCPQRTRPFVNTRPHGAVSTKIGKSLTVGGIGRFCG